MRHELEHVHLRVALDHKRVDAHVDESGDGKLDRAELERAGVLDEQMVKELDLDGDGELSRAEFVERLVAMAKAHSEGSGSVSSEELLLKVSALVDKVLRHRREAAVEAERSAAQAEKDALLALHGRATKEQFRNAMSAAVRAIDADSSGTLERAELLDAGLDGQLIEQLSIGGEGAAALGEFVDAIVELAFPSSGGSEGRHAGGEAQARGKPATPEQLIEQLSLGGEGAAAELTCCAQTSARW